MKNSKSVSNNSALQLLISCLIGAAVGVAMCIILSLAAALIISSADIPHKIIDGISLVILAFSMLAAGFASGKIHHKNGLVVGLITAAVVFLIYTAAAFISPDALFEGGIVKKVLLTLIPSLIGSVAGVNTRRRV